MRAALRAVPAVLSPERQVLAAAIAEAAPLRAAADQARTKAEAARGALASAHAAVPAAEREVEAAKAHLIENPGGDKIALRRCRAAVADAADDLAIAREISARADAAEVEAERSARYAAEAVTTAVHAVIIGVFPAALEAAERAGREFARLAYAAREIAGSGNAWNGEREAMLSRVDTLNPDFALRRHEDAIEVVQRAAAAPWIAARAALLSDPSASLPEVP